MPTEASPGHQTNYLLSDLQLYIVCRSGQVLRQLLYGNTMLTGRLLVANIGSGALFCFKAFLISLYVLMHSTATMSYGLEVPVLLIVLHIYDHINLTNKELSSDKEKLEEY